MKIHEVAKLTGVSVRTLHYYDEIGLLKPNKDFSTNYRYYRDEHLDQLQQILFYKQLNFKLKEIQAMMANPKFNYMDALKNQKALMQHKINNLQSILSLINNTIAAKEGNIKMTNKEKFESFKDNLIVENEKMYGEEIRSQHGEQSVLAAYGKLKDMTEQQYEAAQQLELQLFERLKEAKEDAHDSILLEIAELHKRWLAFYWPKYTKDAHLGLSQIYMYDERFQQYYNERAGENAALLLIQAIELYTKA